jgi:hypothetical protein
MLTPEQEEEAVRAIASTDRELRSLRAPLSVAIAAAEGPEGPFLPADDYPSAAVVLWGGHLDGLLVAAPFAPWLHAQHPTEGRALPAPVPYGYVGQSARGRAVYMAHAVLEQATVDLSMVVIDDDEEGAQ